MTAHWLGFVDDAGHFALDKRNDFKAWVKKFAGHEVVLTLKKKPRAQGSQWKQYTSRGKTGYHVDGQASGFIGTGLVLGLALVLSVVTVWTATSHKWRFGAWFGVNSTSQTLARASAVRVSRQVACVGDRGVDEDLNFASVQPVSVIHREEAERAACGSLAANHASGVLKVIRQLDRCRVIDAQFKDKEIGNAPSDNGRCISSVLESLKQTPSELLAVLIGPRTGIDEGWGEVRTLREHQRPSGQLQRSTADPSRLDGRIGAPTRFPRLPADNSERYKSDDDQPIVSSHRKAVPAWRGLLGILCLITCFCVIGWAVYGRGGRFAGGMALALLLSAIGFLLLFSSRADAEPNSERDGRYDSDAICNQLTFAYRHPGANVCLGQGLRLRAGTQEQISNPAGRVGRLWMIVGARFGDVGFAKDVVIREAARIADHQTPRLDLVHFVFRETTTPVNLDHAAQPATNMESAGDSGVECLALLCGEQVELVTNLKIQRGGLASVLKNGLDSYFGSNGGPSYQPAGQDGDIGPELLPRHSGRRSKRLLSGFCASGCGSRRQRRLIQPRRHVLSLPVGRDALASHDLALPPDDLILATRDIDLESDSAELQDSNNERRDNRDHSPPIGVRFALFFGLFLGGFLVSLWGWLNLYRQRRLVGAAWICGGLLLSASSLTLLPQRLAWPWRLLL